MIDSHCHLADDAFVADLAQVVARAQEAGVRSALCILAADASVEIERAAAVKAAWPAVRFAAAIHPHRAGHYAGRAAEAAGITAASVRATGAVGIGEIGLDYHYDFAPRAAQHEVFAAHVALAVDLNLPVVIHTRLATDDTVAILRDAGAGRVRGVMHCFSGTMAEARQALDLGFFISLSGILTFPKAGDLRDVARALPADRLLIETDAPYLAPVPHRGQRNEPAWVRATLETLATVRQTSVEELAGQVRRNFATLLGLPDAAADAHGLPSRVDTPPIPMV
jgi:TatD DNase family protein